MNTGHIFSRVNTVKGAMWLKCKHKKSAENLFTYWDLY